MGSIDKNKNPNLALILSTSGSTGSTKCVGLSFENLDANTESICSYLNINSSEKAALILLYYCYGLSVLDALPTHYPDQRTPWIMWIFFSGMLIADLKNIQHKLLFVIVISLMAIMFFSGDWPRASKIILATGLVLCLPTLKLPSILAPPITILSSASLFIYMTHEMGLAGTLLPPYSYSDAALRVSIGLAQGVVVWLI